MTDDLAVEVFVEMRERLDPASRVVVIAVDQGAVDIEEEASQFHRDCSKQVMRRL